MLYDIFLFKGHGTSEKTNNYDPGAVYNNKKEFDYINKIVNQALIYLKPLNINIHVDESNFTDIDTKGNTYRYNCGLSVHINAGGGTGTEIYVPLNETYFTNDLNLINSITTLLNIPNRGIKSRDYNSGKTISRVNGVKSHGTDYYGEIREAWRNGVSLSLLEVGFIDTNDINLIEANIDNIAYCIATYIANICNTSLPATNKRYRLIVSDIHNKQTASKIKNTLSEKGYKCNLEEY